MLILGTDDIGQQSHGVAMRSVEFVQDDVSGHIVCPGHFFSYIKFSFSKKSTKVIETNLERNSTKQSPVQK